MKPTWALETNVKAGFVLEQFGEARPVIGRAHRPAGIGSEAEPLALNPDQGEVAARGPDGAVALVEHNHAHALAGEAPGGRHAHQAAADDGDVVFHAHALAGEAPGG